MPEKKLIILEAGGFSRSFAELAELLGEWGNIYFADDGWQEHVYVSHNPIISNIQPLEEIDLSEFKAFANNQIRQKWLQLLLDLSIPLTTIIHPKAITIPSVKIG